WIITYLIKTLAGGIAGENQASLLHDFQVTTANPWISVGATILFILLNVIVISRGVVSGIEKMSKFMMPALFILFIV
ncbi:hypothetical protein U2179_16705, partial [Listeria monocytogenes]